MIFPGYQYLSRKGGKEEVRIILLQIAEEHFKSYFYYFFPLCRRKPLCFVQMDLGLVEPGADVSQVLIKYFYFILVALDTSTRKRLSVPIR